jgi:cyclophilin family peptidyl-prolyl cis-trans isomerase
MARWASPWRRATLPFTLAGLLTGGLAGCGGKDEKPAAQPEPPTGQTAKAESVAAAQTPVASMAAVDSRWRQSFKEATREEPSRIDDCPPDRTVTGKSVGPLYLAVQKLWDDIPLVNGEGKPLIYPVTLRTVHGDVTIALHAAWAPNHVRSFVALAKAGYYDGLRIDDIVHQRSDVATIPDLDLLLAGSPLGNGEPRAGEPVHSGIGYWLKFEIDPSIKHDVGSVGIWHPDEPDSDACRFYVTLSKAPTMDGLYTIFGQVSAGLDVLHKIRRLPVREAEEDPEGYHRPDEPVVILKAVVHPAEVDK